MVGEYTRGGWVFSLALTAAAITGMLAFLLAYSFFQSIIAIYTGIVVAIFTFIPAYRLADNKFPHYRLATIYDDPAPATRIIDENGEEVLATQSSPATTVEPQRLDSAFLEAIEVIEKEFHPTIVRNDAELKNLLFALLSKKYPGRVRRDVDAADGKIDIVLDDIYGIELKVVRDEKILRNLIGDVAFYAGHYRQTAIVLFLDRLFAPKIDLEKYTEKFDQYGTIVVVRQGMIEGRY